MTGPSLDAIKGTVKSIEREMEHTKGLANVKSDLTETYEQYNVKVDQNKASENGLSASQLAMTLSQNAPEQAITKVKENGKSVDVKVKKDKETHWTKEKLEKTELQTQLKDNSIKRYRKFREIIYT